MKRSRTSLQEARTLRAFTKRTSFLSLSGMAALNQGLLNNRNAATLTFMYDSGFPRSASNDARVLILGSMPSRKSLTAHQYYAHPQNAFWPIMAELLNFETGLEYTERLQQLHKHRVALWDVAHTCVRPGSLDSAIEMETVITNDFTGFFTEHPHIGVIFFNGRKAEELYNKLVLAKLPMEIRQIKQFLLPSTSPANAGLSRSQKLGIWKIITDTLESS